MSLVNWNLTPQCVELVTDTLAYDREFTGLFRTTKFLTVPHARIIFAEMGAGDCALQLQRRLLNCDLPHGIDDVTARAPTWMAQIHAAFLEEHGDRLDGDRMLDRWNVVIFGWSEAAGRVIGRIFNSAHEFRPEPIADGEAFNPVLQVDRADPRVQTIIRQHGRELTRFESPGTFIAAAKLQQIDAQKRCGGGIGGDLLCCTLTRDRIETRKIWMFPDPAAEPAAEPRRGLGIRLEGGQHVPA